MKSKREKHPDNDPGNEIRQRGAVTDYRPNDKRISGGSDRSVQSEATGKEGSGNLANSGSTSGGHAGRVDIDLDKRK